MTRPGSARRAIVLTALVALGSAGCASTAALDAAGAGRLADLKNELATEARRGRLAGEARAIARATASGEIARAQGADGLERLRDLELCAAPLEDALDARADAPDEVAAAAAMMLLEARLIAPSDVRAKAGAPGERGGSSAAEAGWRAVGARTLSRLRDATRRRELLADGDTGVRLAALRAAADAADLDDLDALFDVARADPAPLARTLAVRALAQIGGDRVVSALGDLWPAADEPLREAIVTAWSGPRCRDVGGRAKLVATVTRQKGTPAITAASIVATDPGATPIDRGEAAASLVRAIAAGPARERAHAIGLAPEVDGVRDAVVAATADPEPVVALAALARRVDPPASAGSPAHRDLVAKLVTFASSARTAEALRARAILARVRAPEVAPLLERALTSSDARVREAAGVAFARFGKPSRAAFLLADPDPRVRTATACALLSSGR